MGLARACSLKVGSRPMVGCAGLSPRLADVLPARDCVSETICDTPRFLGQDESTAKPYTLQDPSAATCVLTALRDGTPGTVSWSATGAAVPGQFSHGTRLYIRANRVVLSEWHEYADAPFGAESRGPSVLADATTFTACLAETDPDAIWDCLEGWEDHCAVP